MTRKVLFAAWVAVAVHSQAPADPPKEVKAGDRTFQVPEGFTIERVAASPLVDRPIVCDFDEEGGLYVADPSGSNDNVQEQLKNPTHRIVRLVDKDGDGVFDGSTVFADKMMFPEGALWFDGSLYVSAPPSIWKLTDTDGDQVADKREEWHKGKTLTGCANDLHGPYLGLDGWIYWCKGAFAEQTYDRPGKPPFVSRAAHIFRKHPQGTLVEPVMTGGMDNPVDVVFTPGGERIFTTTFLVHPGGGERDGLIHAIYGGVYGKVHDVIDGHPRTGPDLMPVLVHLGPAAPAGLARYESTAFGSEFQNNLFAAQFNLRKVSRHSLREKGATFTATNEDFVVSADQDFHPTDVQEDADGSLLIVDTGGWYKLCCPTSQLVKPDVLGGIYRVRRKEAPKVDDPRGLELDWKGPTANELANRLGDSRPAVRKRAIASLAKLGPKAVASLDQKLAAEASAETRANIVWALCRIGDEPARAAIRKALKDTKATVRQAALHSLSVLLDKNSAEDVASLLDSSSLQNRRAAAEALGRFGASASIPKILEAIKKTDDRVLEHSLIYALIEIGDADAISDAALKMKPPSTAWVRVLPAWTIALDQIPGNNVHETVVIPDGMSSTNEKMRRTAAWIASLHPEWSGVLVDFLKGRIAWPDRLTSTEKSELLDQVAKQLATAPMQDALESLLGEDAPEARVEFVLKAIAASPSKELSEKLISQVASILTSNNQERSRQFAELAVLALKGQKLTEGSVEQVRRGLMRLANDRGLVPRFRLQALSALPGRIPPLSPELENQIWKAIGGESPLELRQLAADLVARADFDREKLLAIASDARDFGPLELVRLLPVFQQTDDPKVGLELVESLEASGAMAGLKAEQIRPILEKYPEEVKARAEKLYALLDAEMAGRKTKLEELLGGLEKGDVRAGQAVFNGSKAGCKSCHAIGYVGGKIGPDLTRVGEIRNERDLLEAIVYPSASFVRSYEPVAIATSEGKVYSGLVKSQTASEIVLTTGADQEVRIPKASIEELKPGTVSVMPSGFDQQLTKRELADVIAFLKACR